jgi:hypothetical protein
VTLAKHHSHRMAGCPVDLNDHRCLYEYILSDILVETTSIHRHPILQTHTNHTNQQTSKNPTTTQTMPSFTKTPYAPKSPTIINNYVPTNTISSGGSGASEKFQKQQAEKQGLGADNAAGHTEGHVPGEAPVASDSGSTNVGQDPSRANPGTQGIKGEPVSSKPDSTGANMK